MNKFGKIIKHNPSNKNTQLNFKDSIEIYEYKSKYSSVHLIFPVRKKENIQKSISRYIALNKNHYKWSLFFKEHLNKFEITNNTILNKKISDQHSSERILLIGNKADDHTNESLRVEFFSKKFRSYGSKTFLLPVNADIGLTELEQSEFKEKICNKFGTVIFMGGDDISPNLYSEINTSSKNTFKERDLWESKFIKPVISSNKTIIVGICRGAQLISANLGYSITQDITSKKLLNSNHTGSENHFIYQVGSSTFLNAKNNQQLIVNSYHHQSIQYISGGPLQITHISGDGIGEAFEIKGKKSLLVQFHPEMNYKLNSSVIFFNDLNSRQNKTRPFGRV